MKTFHEEGVIETGLQGYVRIDMGREVRRSFQEQRSKRDRKVADVFGE